ncbi:MAG: hypothetical protein ABW034_00675, partial [Steroidobacteraceae bacterium]
MRRMDGIYSKWAWLLAAALFAPNVVVSGVAAQPPPSSSPPLKSESMTVLGSAPRWLEAIPLELKDPTTAAADLCRDKPGDPNWLSQWRAGLYRTMCLSAARF